MDRKIPQDELEYRRYVQRLARRERRRRKVMIARTVTAAVLILLLVLFSLLIRMGVHAIQGSSKSKTADKKIEQTAEPTIEPLDYSVPEGYETYSEQLEALRTEYPDVENILLNLYEYPESLLKLVVSNQETMSFVVDYPKHKSDSKPSGTITQEELEQGIPRLQQWDSRWGYLKYGNDMIAIDGCGPTCLSMVCSGMLQDASLTPDAMADFSIDNNYYTAASGSAWSLMSSGARKQGLQAEAVVISADNIRSQLEKGHPMICSMKPGDFTTTGHFIVLTGLTDAGEVTVNDPNSIARSEQSWDMDTLVPQIKAGWAYTTGS